jgi:hypothetical protein
VAAFLDTVDRYLEAYMPAIVFLAASGGQNAAKITLGVIGITALVAILIFVIAAIAGEFIENRNWQLMLIVFAVFFIITFLIAIAGGQKLGVSLAAGAGVGAVAGFFAGFVS